MDVNALHQLWVFSRGGGGAVWWGGSAGGGSMGSVECTQCPASLIGLVGDRDGALWPQSMTDSSQSSLWDYRHRCALGLLRTMTGRFVGR